ncbi:MAG: MG2 domain-containing protein [Aminivibrio sp.]|jgi:uncharacterized protein YfaS (alpha-2-macroglobulin family)
MKKVILAFLVMTFFLGGAGLSEGAPVKEFSVLSFSPSGQVKGRPPIRVAFSGNAVSREVVGKILPADEHPLSFAPSLSGEGKWTDQKTFVFTPLVNLPPATLFRVEAKDGLKDLSGARLAGKQSWEFATEALRLIKVQQVDSTRSGNAVLELTFNLPVSPFRLRGFLSLAAGKTSYSYSLLGTAPSSRIQINTSPVKEPRIFVTIAEGLTSDAGPLGISSTVRHSVNITSKMTVTNVYANTNYPDKSSLYVHTSQAADMAKVAGFVELSPKTPFTIEPGYSGFSIVGDFKPRDRVEVTIKKGMPGRDGTRLEADFSKALIFPDMYPNILLPAAGTFLSPEGDLKIPIETVNIEEVSLDLWRVYENNIPVSMTMNSYSIPRDLARRVATVKARPEGAQNAPVRRAIDLRELAGDARGVFLLTASDTKGHYWGEAEQLVAVTDLGITARVAPAGITVWVNTILGMEAVDGASVKVYSKSNQTIASGKTDSSGLWSWTSEESWDSQLLPAIVTVEKGDDLSYLKLDYNLLADESFDTGGRPWSASYDAMVFTPRGVFRPGEQVDFSAVVRDDRRLPPEPFPVVYVVRSSLGREVARGTAMLSEEGMTSFSAELAPAAPTGRYTAALSLPGGEDSPIGRTSFLVEDFVAPRLEVKAASESESVSPGEEVEIGIASSYLFGAPASGLPFEADYIAVPAPFLPKDWRAFAFGDSQKTFEAQSSFLDSGNLDNEGKGILSFEAPGGWEPPASVDLQFIVKVMEESGRWVPTVLKLPFHPYPFYLGIEKPSRDPMPGKETSVRVAAVLPDGEAAGTAEVNASLFLVKRHYNLVRIDGQTRMQVQKELISQAEEKVRLKDGVGTFTFTPRSWGEYVVRFADPASGSSASSEMYAWAPFGAGDGAGSSLMDRISIKTDREKYAPGDTAQVTFRSPFAGNMLVTVDTDRELYRQMLSLEEGEITLSIPLSDEMMPNAYVTAWVIRPVREGEAWSSHRALGTLPIAVEQSERKLSVTLEAPEKIAPGEKAKVRGAVRDGAGKPRKGEVSLFFVDEGILSLTAFKTPDPWNHFMAKRELGLSVYDMYDLLMPLESRETPLLKPGGGAGEDAMAALRAGISPVAARSFLLLSIFAGNFPTDEEGIFETELDLPEFSGKGRLMAVAAAGDAFGSAEKNMVMARDITVELSLPRAVSPGDEFFAPLKIFSSAPEEKRVTVRISVDGPLYISGKREFAADMGGKMKEALFNVRLKAGPGAGTAWLSMATDADGETLTQELDLPVRPANPRTALSGSGVAGGGETVPIVISRDWFQGTEEGRLVLSDFPALDLLGPSNFLMTYPYGCLEQTVSGAWPLLVLPGLAAEIDPALADKEQIEEALNRKIRQIGAMQLYQGAFASWPGLSSPYPWGSVYASHFLVEAKKSGIQVPRDLLSAALSYVRSILPLTADDGSDLRMRENMTLKAYAAYVLALAGEPPLGWMAHIRENSDYLRGSGAVFLAGAYALSSKTSAALKDMGGISPSLRGGDETTLESASRTEALKLLMWTEVDPLSAPAAELAGRLVAEARKKTWNTTQNNAMAVLALGRWMEKTADARKPFRALLRDPEGAEIASFSDGERLFLNLEDLPKGDLTLEVSGEGSAYYAWTSAGVPEERLPAFAKGISLGQTWRTRDGRDIKSGDAVDRGELIEVTLNVVSNAPVRDLIVTDMLPGGMEMENERLQGGADLPPSPNRTYGVRPELRDDRLLLFIDYLDGPMEYKYLLRAVSRGTFIVPPMAAEGMYAPDTGGLTDPAAVEIR